MTLRSLVEVYPSCVGGLISYAVTMLSAARENVSFEKVICLGILSNTIRKFASIWLMLSAVTAFW